MESSGRAWASSGVGAVGWAVLKEFIGWNDMVGCFSRGDLWACGSLILDAIPWTSVISKGKKILRAISAISSAISAWQKAQERARKIIAAAKAAWAAAEKAAAKAAAKRAAQAAKKRAAAAKAAATRAAKRQQKNTGNAVQKTAAGKKSTTAAKQSKGAGNGTSSKKTDQGTPAACTVNSFVPGTKVLMADGTTKPIEDVDNGDTVQATDPETGDTTTQTVTAEIKGEGLKHLVSITIDTDGEKGTGTATVTATDGHPFWVPELHDWIDATELTPGQWLRTSAGTHVQITAVKHRTTTSATVHNLTVSNAHTYYVLAGATPVLVHNTGGNGHMCDISVTSQDGSTSDISLESGDMTPEEASLGYPNNSAFTHTEHRFSRMAGASTGPKVSLPNDPFAGKFPLSAGDSVRMQGQLPPCSRCKGAMNRMVNELGVSVTYDWSGAKGAGSWTAGRRRR
ncbi:polymorphic toxin-type HINT domain-containing protein [Streptomyces xinghaiensis]|uniref:polymorphic toxin-type HINT domain-containing protein n=1 Tax=Streptomyces xinghaiensis TaxID=1038928 RepID=UPI00344813BA